MSQALLKMKRVRQQSYHGHSCVSIRNGHCSAIWGVIALKFRCFHRLKSLQKWGETNNKQKKEHKKNPHNQTPRNRSSCLLRHTKMIEVQLLSSVLPLSDDNKEVLYPSISMQGLHSPGMLQLSMLINP